MPKCPLEATLHELPGTASQPRPADADAALPVNHSAAKRTAGGLIRQCCAVASLRLLPRPSQAHSAAAAQAQMTTRREDDDAPLVKADAARPGGVYRPDLLVRHFIEGRQHP